MKVGHISLDGTKMKANASKHPAMSYDRMKNAEGVGEDGEGWMEQAAAIDAADDALYGADKRGDELPARVGAAALLLGPPGFLFGQFFQLGLLRFGDENKAWYRAMNAVIASVIPVALAMPFGYALVVWVGVVGDALAVFLLGGAAGDEPASAGPVARSIGGEALSITGVRR